MSQFVRLFGLLAPLFLSFTLSSIPSSSHTVHSGDAARDYMNRFNIPANHIQLEWAKAGSDLQSYAYKGVTYKWISRKALEDELVPSHMQGLKAVAYPAGI